MKQTEENPEPPPTREADAAVAGPQRLTIKVVDPSEGDYHRRPAGGGEQKPFVPVTDELRAALAGQVDGVAAQAAALSAPSARAVPGVARVILRPEAVAKSHRPHTIFNAKTCPIIGGNRLGELHVTADPAGLSRVAALIRDRDTLEAVKHISTLQEVRPYTPADALAGFPPDQNRDGAVVARVRVELFRHAAPTANGAIDHEFGDLLAQNGLADHRDVPYTRDTRFVAVGNVPAAAVREIAAFPGTKSVSPMPRYRLNRVVTSIVPLRRADPADFPPPQPGVDYPVVGQIDGGIPEDDALLGPWVVGRYSIVPAALRDYGHGVFVGGLLVFGHRLNHSDPRFPNVQCKLVDVSVFEVGENGESGVNEDDLLLALDEAMRRYPAVRVWSMSIGTTTPCAQQEMSPFGMALDERQKDHNVQFVLAAGNTPPGVLRPWPPAEDLGERDRICPPTDSVHALTVGAVAHRPSALVGENAPAPFTRCGPGPLYAMKPEVGYPGGNTHPDGQSDQVGVLSLTPDGQVAETVGTSISAPLAAGAGAHVLHELDAHNPPAMAAKGYLVHAGLVEGTTADDAHRYVGVGTPPDIPSVLSCTQGAPTLAFRLSMTPGHDFVKNPFPMPNCLFDPDTGNLQAEVLATLIYTPPTDGRCGVEYCRTNVQVTLGTVTRDDEDETTFKGQLDPYPPRPNGQSERQLVQNGLKWVPLKLYRRRFTRVQNREWRLKAEFLQRGLPLAEGEVQECLLLLTIRAQVADRLVYDELVREMVRLGWSVSDLTLRNQQRFQV